MERERRLVFRDGGSLRIFWMFVVGGEVLNMKQIWISDFVVGD